jgi:hypothetical protein
MLSIPTLLTFTRSAEVLFTIVQPVSLKTGDKVIFNIWIERQTTLLCGRCRVVEQIGV